MPNYCNWNITFSRLSEEDYNKLRTAIKRNRFCETVFPQPLEVKKDSRYEHLYFKAEKEYKEKNWVYPPKEWRDEMREKYPYKQLRYNWNNNNRWTKWGMCEASLWKKQLTTDWISLNVIFWTAWSPLSDEVLEKCSEKYHCRIYYQFDEPWCCFSWQKWAENWEIIQEEWYEDWYYWEWVECEVCHCQYDWTNEDDWYFDDDREMMICSYCGDRLIHEFREIDKYEHLVNLLSEVDNTWEDDDYRRECINKIYNTFSLDITSAEFVFRQYQDWVLSTNHWEEWEQNEYSGTDEN